MAVLAAILITKVYKRQGALHTKGVHHLDVVLCGHQDKDKMVDTLHGSCSLCLRQLKQWWTKKSQIVYAAPPTPGLLGLAVLGIIWLGSSPLISGMAGLGLVSTALFPRVVSCTDTPVLTWPQLCLPFRAVLFLRGGKELRRKQNKIMPLPGCAHLFFPPKLCPRDEWVV